MDPNFTKTFSGGISSSTDTKPASGGSGSAKKLDFRTLASSVILALVVLAIVAIMVLNYYSDQRTAEIENIILEQADILQAETVHQFIALDRQINISKDLAVTRKGYSFILGEVAKVVIPRIRYTSIKIAGDDDDTYNVEIRGVAQSLESYLQQVQVIARTGGLFAGAGFTDYKINVNKGVTTVSFEFLAPVTRAFIEENTV